jgi:hypothetical protein
MDQQEARQQAHPNAYQLELSIATLELTEGPKDPTKQHKLKQQMGFRYRQVIGEAIFAMTVVLTLPLQS